jgi:hypothetical protein
LRALGKLAEYSVQELMEQKNLAAPVAEELDSQGTAAAVVSAPASLLANSEDLPTDLKGKDLGIG